MPWIPPDVERAISLFMGTFLPDGARCLNEIVSKDIMDVNNSQMFTMIKTPAFLLRAVAFFADFFFPRLGARFLLSCTHILFHLAALVARSFNNTSYELRDKYAGMLEYRKRVVAEWREAQLDAVICPSFAHPAVTHKFADEVMCIFLLVSRENDCLSCSARSALATPRSTMCLTSRRAPCR